MGILFKAGVYNVLKYMLKGPKLWVDAEMEFVWNNITAIRALWAAENTGR